MTKASKVLLLLLTIAILIIVYIFYARKAVAPLKVADEVVFNIFEPKFVTEKSKSEYYTIDMSYPESSEKKYPELFSYVKNSKQEFLNDFGTVTKEDAIKMNLGGDRIYNYTLITKIATSTKTITFIIEVYTFTGGAHGATTQTTFTYDNNGKYLSLNNVLTPPYLEKISNFARTYFYDKLGSDSRKDVIDSGTEPNIENYSAWYMTDKYLVFIFGQYSVGPYVIGIQEFPLEKKSIENILNPNYK